MIQHAHLRAGASAVAMLAASGLFLAACSTAPSGTSGSNAAASSGTSSAPGGSGSGSGNANPGGSTSVVSSASVPFPIAVGNTWTYKNNYGTTVNKMVAVSPVSGGQQVTMADTITTEGTSSHSSAYFIFHSDGSISYPFSQFSTGNSGTQVRLISGGLLWPSAAALASGRASHDTLRIQFSIAGKTTKVTAHVTVRGGGTQSVTVPAGTYSATVVNMTMSETVEGISVTSEVRSWLASGVGPVKTEVILHEGPISKVAVEDQLISFKKG